MSSYTLQLDTEGTRGSYCHEVAWVIREKDTDNCVEFGEWHASDDTLFIEFMLELGEAMARYDIQHVNAWGKTDWNSVAWTFHHDAKTTVLLRDKDPYDGLGNKSRFTKTDAINTIEFVANNYRDADFLRREHWHDGSDYVASVLWHNKDIMKEYEEFGWYHPTGTHDSGKLKLQNLARFVYGDRYYKQAHHALADCYDAQSVTLFFARHDPRNQM